MLIEEFLSFAVDVYILNTLYTYSLCVSRSSAFLASISGRRYRLLGDTTGSSVTVTVRLVWVPGCQCARDQESYPFSRVRM